MKETKKKDKKVMKKIKIKQKNKIQIWTKFKI